MKIKSLSGESSLFFFYSLLFIPTSKQPKIWPMTSLMYKEGCHNHYEAAYHNYFPTNAQIDDSYPTTQVANLNFPLNRQSGIVSQVIRSLNNIYEQYKKHNKTIITIEVLFLLSGSMNSYKSRKSSSIPIILEFSLPGKIGLAEEYQLLHGDQCYSENQFPHCLL